MKKNKIGTLFLIAILAIAGVGISYAGFSDSINIYGEVQVATVTTQVTDFSHTEIWKVWGEGAPADGSEIAIFHLEDGETADLTNYQNKELVADSWIESDASGDYDVKFGFNNVFPCVDMHVDFTIKYTGTIPVKISDIGWEIHQEKQPWMRFIDVTATMKDNDNNGVYLGHQLHENDELYVELWLHLDQTNELQGKFISGNAWIELFQWNEYIPPCDDPQLPCTAPNVDTILLESIETETSPDPWSGGSPVPETSEGFIQVLPESPTYSYTFFNLGVGTVISNLAIDHHPFYLDTDSVPDDFYSYWDGKTVDGTATSGWQMYMYDIIMGTEPMFYLKYDGTDYKLVDGLEYLMLNEEYLKVTNDYPAGSYRFEGLLTSECGAQCIYDITMIFDNNYPNTIESSTLIFEGSLTQHGDGTYSGTILGVKDFDIYAKEGSIIDSDASSIDGSSVGFDHDAYPLWNPDVPDVYDNGDGFGGGYYALDLSGGSWALWYLQTPGDPSSGPASYSGDIYDPFYGIIDWDSMYAYETGQNWEQTWTWGSEDISIEYLGFDLEIQDIGSGDYRVTLTPAEMPWP